MKIAHKTLKDAGAVAGYEIVADGHAVLAKAEKDGNAFVIKEGNFGVTVPKGDDAKFKTMRDLKVHVEKTVDASTIPAAPAPEAPAKGDGAAKTKSAEEKAVAEEAALAEAGEDEGEAGEDIDLE